MATHPLSPGIAPANAQLPENQAFPFRSEIADVGSVMAQAESVLDLISSYGDAPPTFTSAVSGASTIIRAAIDSLGKIEVAAGFAKAVRP